MLSTLKTILLQLGILSAFLVAGPALVAYAEDPPPPPPPTATEETKANLCAGANLNFAEKGVDRSCSKDGDPQNNINRLITQIVNVFSIIVGIVAVVMIIYGGFRFVTSGGDSGNVSSAKNTVLFAIVGLVIVAFAQIIVKFVLNKATG